MVNMIELNHRFLVIGGLIVACLFYQAPFFAIVVVIVCGCAVYARNRYQKGERVSLGLNGFQFGRQTRSAGRLRTFRTPPNTTRPTASPTVTPRSQTWGNNLSLCATSVSPCDYGTYSPYRGYLTPKMLQSRLNQGSPKMLTEFGSTRNMNASPVYFNKQSRQTTGSLRGKPDMSVNKPDTSYNDICQAKYVGVGVYPTVHLEPSLPHLLSNFNSTMTKSRVTVKLAPREKSPIQKSRFRSLQNESNMGIDELKGTRKRSMKDDLSDAIQKRQKVDSISPARPFLTPPVRFLPNGIDHRFNNHLCDESMLILPPHFASEHDVVPMPLKPQELKKCSITGRGSIESSYSSSKKMSEKTKQRRNAKRKPEHDSFSSMPENKIIRRKISTGSISSSNSAPDVQNLANDATAVSAGNTSEVGIPLNSPAPVANDDEGSHSSLISRAQVSPILVTKSSGPMYVPSYIPTMDDYLQDKILNEQRLQKMLSAISGKARSKEECDGAALTSSSSKEESPSEPASKASESLLPGLLAVTAASPITPAFSFGKSPFVDSTATSLTKSSSLSTESSTSDVNQSNLSSIAPSTNFTTQVLPQAPSPSSSNLSLNVTSPGISSATATSSFSLTSNLNPPSVLPVVTTSTTIGSTSTVSSPFNSSFAMSTHAGAPFKPSTSSLVDPVSSTPPPFTFGQITTSNTVSAVDTCTTTSPPVQFSMSSNLNFGTAAPASLNTSTVTSVTNPLFSFGSTAAKSDVTAFSAGAAPLSLGANATSSNPSFSMTLPTTSVPSMFNAPSSIQAAGTASAGFQFGAFGSQTTSSLNEKASKEIAAPAMAMSSAISSATLSPFGVMTSNNNGTSTSPMPSLFNAVGSKPFSAKIAAASSPFQQGSTGIDPSSQSASSGFAFGSSQTPSIINNAGSGFASPNVSKGVTSQSLAFGMASANQASSFGSNNTGTSLAGVGSNSSTSMSTGTPFSFGNGTAAFATKPSMGGQAGSNEGPLPSFSAGFGSSNAPAFGASNPSFGANNAASATSNGVFGVNNSVSGTSNGGFGANNAGFGASNPGFGASIPGFGATNTGFGASNAGIGASNPALGTSSPGFSATNPGFGATNAGFGSSTATFGAGNAGFGAGNAGIGAGNAGFGTGNAGIGAGNAGFGTGNAGIGAGNAGFGTGNAGIGAGNAGFGTGNAGIGAGNAGFGTGNAGIGAGNAGFGTGNAGIGAGNAGFGTGNAGIGAGNAGFGASNVGSGIGNAVFGGSNSGIGAGNAGFGAGNPGFGASNSVLGTNNAIFGSTSNSAEFGTANVNGNPPPSYSSSIGNAITTFGGVTKQPSTGGFSFGNPVATTATVFGTSTVTSPSTNASFQFNNPSTNHSNTNLFASPSSNNNENNNSSPFAFKTPATQASNNQGFNFNPGAQPSFNFGSTATPPSASSMFSVGTGNAGSRFGKASVRQRINR